MIFISVISSKWYWQQNYTEDIEDVLFQLLHDLFSELTSVLLQSITIVSDGRVSKASAAAALLQSNLSLLQTGI